MKDRMILLGVILAVGLTGIYATSQPSPSAMPTIEPVEITIDGPMRIRIPGEVFIWFMRANTQPYFEYVGMFANCDFDLDHDVDLIDFWRFQKCFGKEPTEWGCQIMDADDDGDVDATDYVFFRAHDYVR